MSRITKIVPQGKYKGRCKVYLEDGTSFSLHNELLAKYGLRTGAEIDEEKIKEWLDEDETRHAYNAALRYLGFCSRTRKELEDYLRQKGYGDRTVVNVIEKLKSYGLVDDKMFARDWVNNRKLTSPRSRMAMTFELLQKGVDREVIDEVIGSISDEDEEKQAFKVAQKYYGRYRNLENRERALKTGQALARRGFSWEIIQRVIRKMDMEY